jgi:hypothetical protein
MEILSESTTGEGVVKIRLNIHFAEVSHLELQGKV